MSFNRLVILKALKEIDSVKQETEGEGKDGD
jgi:hypothetical protein